MAKREKVTFAQKEEKNGEGLQKYLFIYALTTQGVILRPAISSPESLVGKPNIKPPADLLLGAF